MLDFLVERVILRLVAFADDAPVAVYASLDELPAEEAADSDLDPLAVAASRHRLEGGPHVVESAADGPDACHAAMTASDYQCVLTAVVSAAGSAN